MTPAQLDGPRLPPAGGGAPRQLVVFLHGYGADGNDLIGLGREWARALPHAAFVSPNAPEPCGMAPMGRQWFDLSLGDMSIIAEGVARAALNFRSVYAPSVDSSALLAIRRWVDTIQSNPPVNLLPLASVQVNVCAVLMISPAEYAAAAGVKEAVA